MITNIVPDEPFSQANLPEEKNLSPSNPTTAKAVSTERQACEAFVKEYADPEYRELLRHLYARWHEYNRRFFDGRLQVPHLGIGLTHARRHSQCRETTNYGGAIDIIISERIAFGTAKRIVLNSTARI